MSTKKAISTSFVAIFILIITQIIAQSIASMFVSITTLIISKKPGNTGISRDIRTEFTTDLLLSD